MSRSYTEAAQAVQTGVKAVMHKDPSETSPASLRCGVNGAMVDTATLFTLLLKKGVITQEEFEVELTVQMNAEADRYQKRVNDLYGTDKIHIH